MIRTISALNKKRASLNSNDKGFTLIELLVVVIIIGILAAIAIPVYIGVQNSAKDSAAKADLANAKIALIAAYTDSTPQTFPTALTGLSKYGYSGSTVSFAITTPTATSFCLKATGNVAWYMNQDGAPVELANKPSNCTA